MRKRSRRPRNHRYLKTKHQTSLPQTSLPQTSLQQTRLKRACLAPRLKIRLKARRKTRCFRHPPLLHLLDPSPTQTNVLRLHCCRRKWLQVMLLSKMRRPLSRKMQLSHQHHAKDVCRSSSDLPRLQNAVVRSGFRRSKQRKCPRHPRHRFLPNRRWLKDLLARRSKIPKTRTNPPRARKKHPKRQAN